MRYLLRRGPRAVVHDAVQEGGGTMILMMTACGLSIRWDQPHTPWERAKVRYNARSSLVTCKRCRG